MILFILINTNYFFQDKKSGDKSPLAGNQS